MQFFRAPLFHCVQKPSDSSAPCFEYIPDAGLQIEKGLVKRVGPASEVLAQVAPEHIQAFPDALIVPGFIDAHIHYPQLPMIGAYGEELLTWLERYTFPCERRFADRAYADAMAQLFLQELLKNGTTTAMVFATVFPHSVDVLMERALALGMRLIAGKVLMDRNVPEDLQDTADTAYQESKQLIERWHGRDRLLYALTPRFAASCSPAQLRSVARLWDEYPDVYMQTHVAENRQEVEWIRELFATEVPSQTSYLEVYQHFGLVRERGMFAHAIHLEERDWSHLQRSGAAVCFCPSSNLFLGSGLFPYAKARSMKVRVALGTDVGAGTSFSQLQSLNEAYKVVKLQGERLSAVEGFYLATLGGAEALRLEDKLGNLLPGKEADFVVLDRTSTPLLKERLSRSNSVEEDLFVWMTLAGERPVRATYLAGQKVV